MKSYFLRVTEENRSDGKNGWQYNKHVPSANPIKMVKRRTTQFYVLENCVLQLLVLHRRGRHALVTIVRPRRVRCRNRPKSGSRYCWCAVGQTFSSRKNTNFMKIFRFFFYIIKYITSCVYFIKVYIIHRYTHTTLARVYI